MAAIFRTGVWIALVSLVLVAADSRADVATYELEGVLLDTGVQMLGTFTWTYDPGDFENGVGAATFLEIPYTWHDHTDLDVVMDPGSSIEITLAGSVHDDGVDITLFLLEPLTPTTGSPIDLSRSAYEIGGNGFHTGAFLSGDVIPSVPVGVETAEVASALTLRAYPNPFQEQLQLTYEVARSGWVHLGIYDASGREVAPLVDRWVESGAHVEPFHGDDLGAGLYFVRLQSGGRTTLRKVVLLPAD